MARLGIKTYAAQNSARSLAQMLFVALVLNTGCGIFVGNPEGEDSERRPTKNKPIDELVRDKPEQSKPSEISFALTDSPRDDIREVYLTIMKLEVVSKGGIVFEIPLMYRDEPVNLLQFQNGISLALGSSADLPSGEYSETRLTIGDKDKASVVLANGKSERLKVEPKDATIKIPAPFIFNKDAGLAITLDFDLRQSIKKEPKDYVLKPNVRLVENHKAGALTGKAEENAVVCAYPSAVTPDATDDCKGSVTSAKAVNGTYKVSFLPEGSYNIRVYKVNGQIEDVTNVPVKAQEDSNMPPPATPL